MRTAAAHTRAILLALAVSGCGPDGPRDSAAAAASDATTPPATVQTFISTLSNSQRAVASFPFDDPERINWAYVPQSRRGLALGSMNAEQRDAAFALLGTGLSRSGITLAHGVIELEGILGGIEGFPWYPRRDRDHYYMTVFTPPAGTHPPGWRFEGHHLSVNVTDLGPHGQIVAPLFMGANPARVPSGPRAGFRLLAAEQDVAFELLNMLDPRQRTRATISAQTFGDVVTRSDPTVKPMAFAGLSAADMTAGQKGRLLGLLEVYARRMAVSSAQAQLKRINDAGFDRLHFAWAGAHQPGEPHYYRIHGPTVLVEYDNSQGGANHIHTVWRDLENDFGGDLLKKHYSKQPHGD